MLLVTNVRKDSGMDLNEENKQTKKDEFYLCLITYGKVVYWINGEKVIVNKGDIILIPKDTLFYWKIIPTVFHSKYVVSLKLFRHDEYPYLPILDTDKYIHSKVGCYDLIHEKIKIIFSQWTEEKIEYYDIFSSALLIEILTYWNRELNRGKINPEKHRNVESMKRYIQDHYRNKITKEVLADVIRKSPNYAATLFSSITGQTISGYVHSLRIKTAIYMLTESQLTVAEISEFLGYREVSYFNRIFKQHTGKSPSEYFSERPSRIV